MNMLFVGIGGACGSLTRYSLGKFIAKRSKTAFPYATFFINITGAILLGIISSMTMKTSLYALFADGFLGAYTTFSTFMFEGFNLFKNNKRFNALIYIVGSIVIGVIGFIIGANLL